MRKLMMKMSVSVDGFVGAADGKIDWIFGTTDEAATAWIVGQDTKTTVDKIEAAWPKS